MEYWIRLEQNIHRRALGYGGYHGQITMTDQGPVQPYPGGGIQAVDPTGIILLSNGGNYTSDKNVASWMGIDAETGQRLWMKSYTCSQDPTITTLATWVMECSHSGAERTIH